MDNYIYIGNCSICREYGKLEIVINIKTNLCSVMCDEYMAEWKSSVDAINNVNVYRKFDSNVRVRTATLDEIKNMGWEKYIISRN